MKVKVKSPATVANVNVGFDVLGLALNGLFDEITVEKIDDPIVILNSNVNIPIDPELNSAGKGLLALIKDLNLSFGFNVYLKKNIPLSSGLGGSASGAVGSIVGANHILNGILSDKDLLKYALIGESASGAAHFDNIAPCLMGGLTLTCEKEAIRIPGKIKNCSIISIYPGTHLKTSEARKTLPKLIKLNKHVEQSAFLSKFLLGWMQGSKLILKNSMRDLIIEKERKKHIPYFEDIMKLTEKKILGSGISGSGPSLFFIVDNLLLNSVYENLKDFSDKHYKGHLIFISDLNNEGASIEVL